MPERNMISLHPRGTESSPMGNEHIIYAYGDLVDKQDMDFLKYEVAEKLLLIFPKGSNRGNRIEVYHQPTEDELARLRELANELSAELVTKVRTDAEYEAEKAEETSRRSRR